MPSLLLVDDEKDVNEALKMYLEMQGFTVRTALSGQEGLAAVKEAKPDLVMLDLQMPGMDGWQTLQQMRAAVPDLRVAILTGSLPSKEMEERARQGGALGFIHKPIQLDELVPKIKGFLTEGK